jgi:signal transduction histidine kinase
MQDLEMRGEPAGGVPASRPDLEQIQRALSAPNTTIDRLLADLAGRAAIEEASFWTVGEEGRLTCVAPGDAEPSRGARGAAQAAIRGRRSDPGPRRRFLAIPLGGNNAASGALAARSAPGRSEEALELLDRAAPLFALALLGRQLVATRDREAELLLGTQRRLVRFGLDLHDGAAQGIAALLSDLRMFAGQLDRELNGHPRAEILTGRVHDLEHRAAELEAEIRELARTAGGPAVLEDSVAALLRDEVRAFAQQTGITPMLSITGEIDESTPSQQITLLRAIQEALRNAREHSGATAVSIRVAAPPGRLEAVIEDNGGGFDPDRTLAAARRDGRIGLSGIEERARLLGGTGKIRSKPGGPTSVVIELPRWRPGEPPPGGVGR